MRKRALLTAGSSSSTQLKKRKVKKKPPAASERSAEGSAAGHTYDYFKDKWDKFDVDAALADVDADTEYETESEHDTEEPQPVRFAALAMVLPLRACTPAGRCTVRIQVTTAVHRMCRLSLQCGKLAPPKKTANFGGIKEMNTSSSVTSREPRAATAPPSTPCLPLQRSPIARLQA